MSSVKKAIDLGIDACAILAIAATLLMLINVNADVIGKFFFNQPVTGTTVFVANYYMVALVFLPLAFVERNKAHISVEVVTNMMPPWLTRHIFGLTNLLAAVVWGLLTYTGWQDATARYDKGSFIIEQGVSIPIWQSYFLMPLSFGLLTIFVCLKFIAYVIGSEDEGLSPLQRFMGGWSND